nr:hypothetical protein [Tanacetum cinerariifolium]
WPPRKILGRLLPHARGLGFKPRHGGFPSGAKKEWGLSPKANVRVLHTAQLDVTSCSYCSKVFTGDMYGDHVVSCAGIIGIKHRHNAVRDTLVDICFRLGISTGKEVDIELGGGCDKVLRPADMLLYSWDSGFDVCVDLTGSSPLTRTGMADFVSGRAVIDILQRKRGKYMAKCVAIGYEFC